jgi:hypothetical protein
MLKAGKRRERLGNFFLETALFNLMSFCRKGPYGVGF